MVGEESNQNEVVEGLIESLAGGGELVDGGGFTLDPAAALTKLRGFQLGDPSDYLLVLVEAGWLAGAGKPEGGVSIASGALTSVEFRGLALAHGSLPDLFAAALAGASADAEAEARTQARILQLLGLAANAALALEPRRLRLTATDADGRAERIEIEPGGGLSHERLTDSRLRPGTVRFELYGDEADWERTQAQVDKLGERCRYSALPIRVDARRVSRGLAVDLRGPATEQNRVEIEIEGRPIGVVGHTLDHEASPRLVLVNRGVAIIEPLAVGPGIAAVVEVDLPVDLARKQLVEGPELAAIRGAVEAAAARLEPLPERAPEPKPEPEPAPVARSAPPARPTQDTPSPRQLNVFLFVSLSVVTVLALVMLGFPQRAPKPDKDQVMTDGLALIEAQNQATLRRLEPRQVETICIHAPQDDPEGARGCLSAANLHALNPSLRDAYLRIGCTKRRDPEACKRMVRRAREHVGGGTDLTPVGLALVESCLAIPGPDCVNAADHLRHGYYPSPAHVAEDYYMDRQPFPDVSEPELLARACAAGIVDACSED